MIPQQRLTLSAIGDMGFGKSTAMGRVVKWALDSGQFTRGAFLYVSPYKEEETIPKYPSEVKHVPGRTLPMSHVKHYIDSIIIAEDVLRLDERSKRTVAELTETLGRNNRDLVIVTTQKHSKEYESHTKVFFKWANDKFVFDIYEGDKDNTGNIDWTSNSEPNITPIIDALQNGVAKRVPVATKGKPGRPVTEGSLYNRCCKAFDAGKRPTDIVHESGLRAGTLDYQNIYTYYNRWKGKKAIRIDTSKI